MTMPSRSFTGLVGRTGDVTDVRAQTKTFRRQRTTCYRERGGRATAQLTDDGADDGLKSKLREIGSAYITGKIGGDNFVLYEGFSESRC